MKISLYLTALCLAGLGLAAPAPIHNERGLQAERAAAAFDIDTRDVGLEKRKSKPKTTKKPDPVTTKKPDPTTRPADQTTTKAVTTSSKSSSTSSVASSTTVKSSTSSSSSVSSKVSSSTSSSATSSSASSSASSSISSSASSSVSSSASTSATTSGTATSNSLSSTFSSTTTRNGTVTGRPTTTKLSSTITSSASLTSTGNSTVTGRKTITTSSASLTTTGNSTITGGRTSTTPLSSTTRNGTVTTSSLLSSATANGTATTSGAFCTRPTGKGKVNARGDDDNSSCGEDYIDFGNGWRTPLKSEQSKAQVKTPTDNGGTQPARYRTMTDDFPKPPKEKNQWNKKVQPARDCPADQDDVLTKQVDGHSDNGAMITPPKDGVLFYSVVEATEHEWAAAEGKGFYFMLDIVKESWIDWVRFAMGCKQFWPIMSKATALLAKGDVHVLLPSKTFEVGEVPKWPTITREGKVGQRSVWDEHEWPTLLRENQGACRVWRWNKSTNKPDLLAVRTNGGCSGYPASPEGANKKTYSWTTNTLS